MEVLNEAPRGPKSVSKACLQCRSVKMKCVTGESDSRCERCTRKSLTCVFQDHRRGRKPGTRIAKRNHVLSKVADESTTPQRQTSVDERQGEITGRLAAQRSPDWDNGTLQPAGIFNTQTTQKGFCLGSILNTSESTPTSETQEDIATTSSDDPIQLGLVNLSIASSLFEKYVQRLERFLSRLRIVLTTRSFMKTLNPYISQLDPQLHTFGYVRQKSSFLMTTVLAAAAKAFNPSLHKKLRDHAEDMLSDNLRKGSKSVETAQAIMIMTYWKDPDDTRAWMYLGFVIRMAMELGWHRFTPYSSNARETLDEAGAREARNTERTWLVLFVYDRSMSLQTGKPWMIERSGFIESVEAWGKDPLAIPNDRLLGALVTLRLLSSEVFRLLGSRSNRFQAGQLHTLESLLAIINGRIEEWESRWLSMADRDCCHPFLIQFYGTHLRLQLFSLPLQEVLGQSNQDASYHLEALWVSYSSALEMLHLICRHSSWLYFAQDSIHVMTAYSAAFLIKLLMYSPESITRQVESAIKSAISGAALVFSQQAAPIGSSCALQSKFLDNLMSKFSREPPSSQDHGSYSVVGGANERPHSQRGPGVRETCDGARWSLSDATTLMMPGRGTVADETGLTFESAEEATWASLIAEAGFSAQDGVFFT